jgi:hypothetical protein
MSEERRADQLQIGSRPSGESVGARQRVLSSLVSRSIPLAMVALLACDPTTTRPDVTPIPEARTIEVRLSRQGALTKLHQALVADSFPIQAVNSRDAWLETPWFDALTLRPTGAQRLGRDVVKLRGWADPARPGNSLLVVELVYRPLVDPSVPQRELDRPVPPTDSIYIRVGTLLKALDDEIGFHGAGQ